MRRNRRGPRAEVDRYRAPGHSARNIFVLRDTYISIAPGREFLARFCLPWHASQSLLPAKILFRPRDLENAARFFQSRIRTRNCRGLEAVPISQNNRNLLQVSERQE